MDPAKVRERAAAHWSRVASSAPSGRRSWWQSPTITGFINAVVANDGVRPQGVSAGFHHRLAQMVGGRRLDRAISIGCGAAWKELALLQTGLVGHFDLYEISSVRIEQGKKRAADLGLLDRIAYHEADAFADPSVRAYDLVYWNNSLHHMLDVDHAIAWSVEHIRRGGWFAMDDFVGPSRFQWSDRALYYANSFRRSLPEPYFCDPDDRSRRLALDRPRPTVQGMIESDPSEAADSGRIVQCLRKRLPNMHFRPTGGVIYMIGLGGGVLGNFNEVEDQPLLYGGLLLDKALGETGDTLYAVAIAQV